MTTSGRERVLSLRISVDYPGRPQALHDLMLRIDSGEILGLVGESGSGKSTLALAILRLLNLRRGTVKGQICFEGRDLMRYTEAEMRDLRGRQISLVLQSPLTSLNPCLKVGTQLKEAYRAHAQAKPSAWRTAALATLRKVSLSEPEQFLNRYPAELSVGQAQRVLIASAILHLPSLLIADEPTSALDPITAAEIVELFCDLNHRLGMAILYISHDLLSVASFCHRVAIMRNGELLEVGEPSEIFQNPSNPYTQRLIEALPRRPKLSPSLSRG